MGSASVVIVVIGASILAIARKNANCRFVSHITMASSTSSTSVTSTLKKYTCAVTMFKRQVFMRRYHKVCILGTVVNCEKYLAEIYEILTNVCLSVFYITY